MSLLQKKFMLVKLQSSFNDKDSHINSSWRSNGVNEVLNFSHLQIPILVLIYYCVWDANRMIIQKNSVFFYL